MAQAPTGAGNARLASVYDMLGRSQEALETVQQALAKWPDKVSLLTAGATLAGRAGEKASQLRYLERAVVLEPHDNALRQMLECALHDQRA